jgi:creatinine amidohydrolase
MGKPLWGRYTELRPHQLSAIQAQHPVAFLPWGALEWHGPHLPFGLDGITAETIAERVVQRTGGVLLPTTWWPITTLPHAGSLALPSTVVRALWDAIFTQMAAAEWRVLVILSGHYAQGHELVLMDAAEQAMRSTNLLVLATPPLAMVDETMLDHAALWESSQLLALRPDLVDMDALGEEPLRPETSAVLGRDPRNAASHTLGQRALSLAVERVSAAVLELARDGQATPLYALYARRRARYQQYIERYVNGGSYEDGLAAWWADICRTESRE